MALCYKSGKVVHNIKIFQLFTSNKLLIEMPPAAWCECPCRTLSARWTLFLLSWNLLLPLNFLSLRAARISSWLLVTPEAGAYRWVVLEAAHPHPVLQTESLRGLGIKVPALQHTQPWFKKSRFYTARIKRCVLVGSRFLPAAAHRLERQGREREKLS